MARALIAACALLLSACGQNGALRLPDEPGEVVNAPAASPAGEDAAASDKEKEDASRPRP